jgi:drug/metabolite transporter (DMT)-like permease
LTKQRAVGELIFAGALWGFGFVATVWALQVYNPAEVLTFRFIAATVFGELIYLIVKGPRFTDLKEDLLRALPAGIFLASMLILQTIGLQYTTATKSGFLTSLYVILVPIINTLFFKQKNKWHSYLWVLLALLGTFMLMGSSIHGWNVGDLWTLGCSVIAACHIIYIGQVTNKVGNAFRFNNFQSFWALILCAIYLAFLGKTPVIVPAVLPWVGILTLGMCSSVIAFYLQIRTQRILSDSTASMIFLLESPFAALFAFFLLQETLSLFQTLGAVLILVASALQILTGSAKSESDAKS